MTDLDTRAPSPHRRRTPFLAAGAVVVVIGVAVGLALFQPWKIFTRSTVDESLPVSVSAAAGSVAGPMTDAVSGSVDASLPVGSAAAGEPATEAAQAPAAAPVPVPVAAPAPAEPAVLASGSFVDGEHSTSGRATVLQLPDGSRFVRLEDFSTSDGPDVHVWITDQQAGGDDWGKYDDGRYLELGSLKGTDGNQNYAIPADADLAGLTSVIIWCDRFNVAFGSAPVTL
jgi:hypothetical protein